MIKFDGMSKHISNVPVRKELESLTCKELFSICCICNIGLKKVLIDYLMSKKKFYNH